MRALLRELVVVEKEEALVTVVVVVYSSRRVFGKQRHSYNSVDVGSRCS